MTFPVLAQTTVLKMFLVSTKALFKMFTKLNWVKNKNVIFEKICKIFRGLKRTAKSSQNPPL